MTASSSTWSAVVSSTGWPSAALSSADAAEAAALVVEGMTKTSSGSGPMACSTSASVSIDTPMRVMAGCARSVVSTRASMGAPPTSMRHLCDTPKARAIGSSGPRPAASTRAVHRSVTGVRS
jgi:hypothetical protein